MPRRLHSLRGLVVMLAIAALTGSLATRYARVTVDKVPTIHSLTSKATIQHRDRDADERSFATADFSLLWVAEPATTVERSEPVYVKVRYQSLYNRPPPCS